MIEFLIDPCPSIRSRGHAREFALEDRSNLEDLRFDGLRTFDRFPVFRNTQNCVRLTGTCQCRTILHFDSRVLAPSPLDRHAKLSRQAAQRWNGRRGDSLTL